MKKFYPGQQAGMAGYLFRTALAALVLLVSAILHQAYSQELVFKNSQLESGTSGQDNAVYRFPNVTNNVDALVTINGRSSSLVQLVSIDLTNTGFDKAFQPQVTYNNNTTPSGTSDWWMEFQISFVQHNSNTPVSVSSFDLTSLDIDGNGDKINEWVNLYGLSTYSLEANTLLTYSSVYELVNSVSTVTGMDFSGPVTNFSGIDTSATTVMASAHFDNLNSFRLRTGGHSTGSNGAANRMYSFWFKSFNFLSPVQLRLPVSLESFTVQMAGAYPKLDWTAASEKNFSHYVIERSSNGTDFNDAGLLFTAESNELDVHYSFTDKAAPTGSGILYYRLKMVDLDGRVQYSATRLVRLGADLSSIAIQAYPNPAHNELRVTIPSQWQQKRVSYQVFTISGQAVRQWVKPVASQTEVLDISPLPEGIYLLRAFSGNEQSVQRFIKTK